MLSVPEILKLAEISHETFGPAGTKPVFLTAGNQLIGTFKNLSAFRDSTKDYHGWHAHHVVETHDLGRLNVTTAAPSRKDQLCVLLPERAHIGRVNSLLRTNQPIRTSVTARELLASYREAYDLIGDYCGGGEKLIREELLSIVRATFRAFQLI